MKNKIGLGLMIALLAGCSNTVLVSVPPRMDLKSYGTYGIVEFDSGAGGGTGAQATRRFQEQLQAAQPGTRFVELRSRQAVLAAVGASQLDAAATRKIAKKYGVDAIFLGELAYSEPNAELKMRDLANLGAGGGIRAEVRGDISARLVEAASGASLWSSSAWARRQIGAVNVSAEYGVSAAVRSSDPKLEMLPTLVYELTHDFRPSTVRQAAK